MLLIVLLLWFQAGRLAPDYSLQRAFQSVQDMAPTAAGKLVQNAQERIAEIL